MGGELMNLQLIENYPGFGAGVQGPELGSAMLEQATHAGAEIEIGEVVSIKNKAGYKLVKTTDQSLTCQGIIIASGAHPKKLGVPGELDLAYKGVFYCATCDGANYAGKAVAVAGAGDSGLTDALYLERLGCQVTVVELMAQPKASRVMLERAEANPNIEIQLSTKIETILGEEQVTAVNLQNVTTSEQRRLDVEGVLVRIGPSPNTQFLQGLLELTPIGQIPVNENMETSIPGIYAAGDVREHSPMQIATAVGDGVIAAMALGRYLQSL